MFQSEGQKADGLVADALQNGMAHETTLFNGTRWAESVMASVATYPELGLVFKSPLYFCEPPALNDSVDDVLILFHSDQSSQDPSTGVGGARMTEVDRSGLIVPEHSDAHGVW